MRATSWMAALLLVLPGLVGLGCGDSSEKPAPRMESSQGPEVWLLSFGDRKISTIAAVREITGLGLADSKALVEGAPRLVKVAGDRAEAEAHAKKLRDAGATVEIR